MTVKELHQQESKLQILAPAGSCEQLVAAVNNGCDAVYLGLDSFNARMKAPNFSLDNLSEWVDYCHLFGVKVYVTINTSIKNDEFARATDMLKSVYLKNADGVIVTDLALMRIAGSFPKPFDVIASTQLNVHDKYGAEFVKQCGATSVVCARECSYEQISEIASAGLNVETFLHGAMCVCQSGQCLFSSMVGGNSGNRGLCAQPCRKKYFAKTPDGIEGYLLSARDICSLNTAKKLVEAGATSFKIEGRNRRAEYAAITSRVYRKLFDNGFHADEGDFDKLAETFNRGMTFNRYLSGANDNVIYPSAPNHIGVLVGVIKRGELISFKELRKGDGLKVLDGNKEVCGGIVLRSGIGTVDASFSCKVADGMQVFRTTSVAVQDEVFSAKKNLKVDVTFKAKPNSKAVITARCFDIEATVVSDFVVEQAVNRPSTVEEVAVQLQKSGETHYTISNIVVEIDDIFLAKSQLNALRRAVLEKLTRRIVDGYNMKLGNRRAADMSSVKGLPVAKCKSGLKPCKGGACAAICYDEQQLRLAKERCAIVIFKPDAIDSKAFEIASRYDAYVDLPSFTDLNFLERILDGKSARLLCNNVGQVQFAHLRNLDYIAGRGLNIFNDEIAERFSDAKTFVYSYELTLKEIGDFANSGGLIFVDGKLPLMQLCHCPYKVALGSQCSACKADKPLVYTDELGNSFAIRRRSAGRCAFELFNGNKLSVVSKLKKSGNYLLDYDENVLNHYLQINMGIDDGYVETSPYTKGRLYDKIN